MNWKKFWLAALLLDFLTLTGYAIYAVPLTQWWELITLNAGTVLLTVDLCIALVIACGWTIADARSRGLRSAPFVALTLLGSAGPIAYLLYREFALDRKASARLAAQAA